MVPPLSVADLTQEFYDNRDQESLFARGTVTAPGVGAAIATLAAPPVGTYEITVIPRYGGTADVIDNMDLRVQGVVQLVLPVLPVVNGVPQPIRIVKKLSGAQNITVNAVAAGGVGSIFVAHIIATKIGNI